MKRNDTREIDGAVLAYQVEHRAGLVAVTLAGGENAPIIVVFDRADLDALNRARKELRAGIRETSEPDPGAVLSILAASRADRFVYDRVEYRYDPQDGGWVAWGRVDTDGDPQPGVTFITERTW